MHIRFSREVEKQLKQLKRNDKQLFARIQKKVKFFSVNPKHPSLRIHKLSGKLGNLWSISISRGIQMVYLVLEKDEVYVIDIGTHDQVYKK